MSSFSRCGLMPDLRRTRSRKTQARAQTTTRNTSLDLSWDPLLSRSQRASFEVTHPAVMATAGRLASEPVLRVADLGAADGVNSHGLVRDLVAQRAGRPLIYALVAGRREDTAKTAAQGLRPH